MAVFAGPSGYISPSWYEDKSTVPTWDYVAVHAYGIPTIMDEPSEVRNELGALVDKYEGELGTQWTLDQSSEEYLRRLAEHIVMFRMKISRFEAQFKLSQNRSVTDKNCVADSLEAIGDDASRELARFIRSEFQETE